MENLCIKRISSSSYFSNSFITEEKKAFQELNLDYLGPQDAWPKENQKQIWITNTHTQLPESFPSSLAMILHPNSGFDNLFPQIEKYSGPVVLGNPIRAQAVSEMILAIIFQHYIKLIPYEEWKTGRSWDRSLLQNKKVLLVGYGHIGKKVKAVLEDLGMKIFIQDPYLNIEFDSEKKYDIIILACSLNIQNTNMINSNFLNKLSSEGIFVNTARGDLVHEEELKNFLKLNPNSFAYLDVLKNEPQDYNSWKKLNNVFVFPHKAGVSKELEKDMIIFSKNVVLDFTKDQNQFKQKYQNLLLSSKKVNGIWI